MGELDMTGSEEFIPDFTQWARDQRSILGAVLVGSHARGTAKPDSDIDVVMICESSATFLEDDRWFKRFGSPTRVQNEDYGVVQSWRVWYASGLEVEFGITTRAWVSADPIDPGTERVLQDGYMILCDKEGLLARLTSPT